MITPPRERRDWTLLVFIIPIGIILMLIAGQVAVRLVPEWSLNAGMQSNLDPNNLPMQQNGLVQPVLPAILTPLGWLDTFLTPGAGSENNAFPPFIIFEPSATPVVTNPPPTAATQPSPTAPTATAPTVVVPPPATGTKPPGGGETTVPPTSTTAVPTPTGTPSTPPPLYPSVVPPVELDVNTPPDGVPGSILPGTYTIVDLAGNPVSVSGTPDGNYDLIFYESEVGPGSIYLDHIIIGVSNTTDGSYYEVFNWGNNVRDENTNVDTTKLPADASCTGASAPECDNRVIPVTALYPDPVSGISTGILIDVDNAPGRPPEGSYGYLVIISPISGDLDSAQVDSVVVAEVPGGKSAMSVLAKEEPVSPAGESLTISADASDPPAESSSESPPAEESSDSPEGEVPAPPAEEAPSPP
jgi:hypothetical protein